MTLKRKITVKFSTLHIYNDGDSATVGDDAQFWFRVSAGDARPLNTLEEFHLPEMDIDDWSETDRPYPLGFAYVEFDPQTIPPDRTAVWVSSWATEDDSPLGDDAAGSLPGLSLDLPSGPGEAVSNGIVLLDCGPTTDGSAFHHGVDVNYSVAYLP